MAARGSPPDGVDHGIAAFERIAAHGFERGAMRLR